MVTLIVVALIVAALELLVWFFAADSTDAFDSPEWERRRTWRAGA